jgi:uncharacterized protein (DUF1697 family)
MNKKYIILLRGVMPTGKNKVPMAALRDELAKAGFGNVRTYIQSGNVLLDSELPIKEVEVRVHDVIKKKIGADLAVVARTASQLKKVLRDNPFRDGYDISRVFFVLFKEKPASQEAKALASGDFGPEKLVITAQAAYMYIPGPYGKGTLSAAFLEKKLHVPATMRNFNTLDKLIDMCKESMNS